LNAPRWVPVCGLDEIVPDSGVCALLGGKQIAVFRVGDAVHAIGNHDPASGVNVLARGIVGDVAGEPVVASPLYKQHFSLISGRCVEDVALSVPTYLTRLVDGQVWVQTQAHEQRRGASAPRLVVIGNGMAATRALEELLALAPQAFRITVFGSETQGGYNRVLLSPLLSGEKKIADVITHPPEWYAERGITLHLGDTITRIDRARRVVHSQRGLSAAYDRLLIATGSRPVILPVPGAELAGVKTFRDLLDVDALLAAARATGRNAVVIGGGLLGLEAASGLQRQGMQVTVVHRAATIMNRQLDAQAAGLLQAELERRGISFRLNARTQALLGDGRVTHVQLHDDTELPADLVVMAVGVRPETAVAKAAGLRCERGILVNDTLQTFDPSIYAVGECVQHRDSTYGLVAPLQEQARVCAAHLAERGTVRYPGSLSATQLKVSGIQVFSAGDYEGGPGTETLVLRDEQQGIYKRLVLQDNQVRGAVLYGDTRDGGWYTDLINEGRDIGAMRDGLLFGEAFCRPQQS
jgi:nitrite reductase (NADH) large subunit